VRFALQPVDVPNAGVLERVMDHLRSDELILFSTDYPHWHFDGEDALPDGLSDTLVRKILIDNPLATYPRLREAADAAAKAGQQPAGQNRDKTTTMREEMAP